MVLSCLAHNPFRECLLHPPLLHWHVLLSVSRLSVLFRPWVPLCLLWACHLLGFPSSLGRKANVNDPFHLLVCHLSHCLFLFLCPYRYALVTLTNNLSQHVLASHIDDIESPCLCLHPLVCALSLLWGFPWVVGHTQQDFLCDCLWKSRVLSIAVHRTPVTPSTLVKSKTSHGTQGVGEFLAVGTSS